MYNLNFKDIAESLINTFQEAARISLKLREEGLKIQIKEDNSPVTNGDLEVNRVLTNKIKNITPNIPVISEETVDLKKKNNSDIFWLIALNNTYSEGSNYAPFFVSIRL